MNPRSQIRNDAPAAAVALGIVGSIDYTAYQVFSRIREMRVDDDM